VKRRLGKKAVGSKAGGAEKNETSWAPCVDPKTARVRKKKKSHKGQKRPKGPNDNAAKTELEKSGGPKCGFLPKKKQRKKSVNRE